jgi:hypothetical protein
MDRRRCRLAKPITQRADVQANKCCPVTRICALCIRRSALGNASPSLARAYSADGHFVGSADLKIPAALVRHRCYFAKLAQRMRAKKCYADSAVLNAMEAAWQATAAAINAVRSESNEIPKEVKKGFELPRPTDQHDV